MIKTYTKSTDEQGVFDILLSLNSHKIATAERLPGGFWRCQAEHGCEWRRDFSNLRDCEIWAAQDYAKHLQTILDRHDPTINSDAINVYCADLAAYNEGRLIGRWFDLSEFTEASDLREAFSAFLTLHGVPGAEEWALHDYDAPASLASHFGEYPDLGELLAAQRALEEHGADWVQAAVDCGIPFDQIEDQRYGEYENAEDLGYQMADSMYSLDADLGALSAYIDYERYGRDLLHDFNYCEINGTLFLFSH